MTTFREFLGHTQLPGVRTCLQAFYPNMQPAAVHVDTEEGYERWKERYNHTAQVYVSINPVREGARKFHKDEDVAYWCNEYLDLDAEKSRDWKGYNATDAELERLKPFVEKINNWLTEHGFKLGYCDMTGNGYRWILPIPPLKLDDVDLKRLAAKKKAFKDKIARECGIVEGCGAHLDSVFDFKRITGMPGTENVKKQTDDRPCRDREEFRGVERDEDQKLRDYIMLMEVTEDVPAPSAATQHRDVQELEKLTESDEKLRQLLDGDLCGHVSRSEAELALACKLTYYGFNDTEIADLLVNVPGSKAAEKQAAGHAEYITDTINKAVAFVSSRRGKKVRKEIKGEYEIINFEQFRKLAARYPDTKLEKIRETETSLVYRIDGDDFVDIAIDLEIIAPHVEDDGTAIVVTSPDVLRSYIGKTEVRKDGADTIYYIEIREKIVEFGIKELMDVTAWRDALIQCNIVLSFDLRKHSARDTWSDMVAHILNTAEVTWEEELAEDDLLADIVMSRLHRLPVVLEDDDFVNARRVLERDGMYIIATTTLEDVLGQILQHKRLAEIRRLLKDYIVQNSAQRRFKGKKFSVWFFKKWDEEV